MNPPTLYCYLLEEVIKVVDGDTFHAWVDVGFGIRKKLRIRILDIDCPERGFEGFSEAKLLLENWLKGSGRIIIRTEKTDGFGRWLSRIYNEAGELFDCSHHLPPKS